MPKLHPFLWFNTEAKDAADFYVSVFPNSKINSTMASSPGTVLTVDFELDGFRVTALNGGPQFNFTEAVSFMIDCQDQKEVDYYWDKLTAGGDPKSHVCGWLKDKYGLSWQVAPKKMVEWFGEPNEKSERVMTALLRMSKLDIAALEKAYEGR